MQEEIRSWLCMQVQRQYNTSFSVLPFGSKSLPPAAPPSLYGDRAFFRVCIQNNTGQYAKKKDRYSLPMKGQYRSR